MGMSVIMGIHQVSGRARRGTARIAVEIRGRVRAAPRTGEGLPGVQVYKA
jgi:hypothetical protein